MRLFRFIPVVALLVGPAVAEEHFRDDNGTEGIVRGAAESAIRSEMTRRNVPCYDRERGEVTCRIMDRALNADVHYGILAGTQQRAALVSVRWQYDQTGNAVDARGYVFLDDGAGRFTLVHAGPMQGLDIRNVSFEPGAVRYVARSMREGDNRANPTGTRRLSIAYSVKGDGVSLASDQPTSMAPRERIEQLLAFSKDVMRIRNDMRFDENLKAVMTPSLRENYENAMSPPQECPVFDGDPRAGGAQGLTGIHAIKTVINADASAPPIIAVDVAFRDRAMPAAIYRSQFRLQLTASGWRVDDFRDRQGKSFRAALKERVRECGSPRAKAFFGR